MYQAAEHRADDSAMGEVDRIFTDELGWMFTAIRCASTASMDTPKW
jgi:hypothetical protein